MDWNISESVPKSQIDNNTAVVCEVSHSKQWVCGWVTERGIFDLD